MILDQSGQGALVPPDKMKRALIVQIAQGLFMGVPELLVDLDAADRVAKDAIRAAEVFVKAAQTYVEGA